MQKSLRVLQLLRIFIYSVVFRFYGILFRFPTDTILFRVLSDRVFFESSEIGSSSSSLDSAAIDSSLHQCSFYAMSLFFIKSCYYIFFIKNRCFVLHSSYFSKTISLTCFNNFTKTDSEKNQEIHDRDTNNIIFCFLNIRHKKNLYK